MVNCEKVNNLQKSLYVIEFSILKTTFVYLIYRHSVSRPTLLYKSKIFNCLCNIQMFSWDTKCESFNLYVEN